MSEYNQSALEAVVAASAAKVTYGGAGMTITGYMLSSEFAVLAGLVIGLAGFFVNWYYKAKEDRRQEREHLMRWGGTDE